MFTAELSGGSRLSSASSALVHSPSLPFPPSRSTAVAYTGGGAIPLASRTKKRRMGSRSSPITCNSNYNRMRKAKRELNDAKTKLPGLALLW